MKTRTNMVVLFLILLVSPLTYAGEGYKEMNSGVTVLLSAYDNTAGNIHSSSALVVDINRCVFVQGATNPWTTLAANNNEIQRLTQAVAFSIGLWENLPTARLSFSLGAHRTVQSTWQQDTFNLVTLAGGTYAFGGQGGGDLALNGMGLPRIVEFDSLLNRNQNQTNANEARVTMIHELGHGMGFNHSWLTQNAVQSLTGAQSPPSIMSYGGGQQAIVTGNALNPDDVALASRLYPNLISPLSRTTGTVRGRALNAAGTQELYGANVLLLNSTSGQAIVSRISGYETSPPNGKKDGAFCLDGVPPGTYDLLMASRSDAQLVTSNPSIDYMRLTSSGSTSWPGALSSFASGFQRGWVRGITVQAGELVEVGYVLAGRDRNFNQPDRVDMIAQVQSSANYKYYWYDFWSTNPWKMAHRSGLQTTKHYAARLQPGQYFVKTYGWNGSWHVLQNWTLQDFRVNVASATWKPAIQYHWINLGWYVIPVPVEPLHYYFFLQGPQSTISTMIPVRGTRYTTHMIAGQNQYWVQGRWNMSTMPFFHHPVSAVSVTPSP